MGSAESSAIRSVENLSYTLEELNNKLGVIENIHLHRERTLCSDDTLVVANTRIQCRSFVTVKVGPIVGLVGPNHVRILIEVNCAADISLNVFSAVDKLATEDRFLFTLMKPVEANTPTVWTINNLIPNSRYIIYIGGVHPSDTYTKKASFCTLPVDPLVPIRYIMTSRGDVTINRPSHSSSNLWSNIEQQLELSSMTPHVVDRLEHDVNAHGLPTTPDVHYIIHAGDFLSVDGVLKHYSLKLLDLIAHEEYSNDKEIGGISGVGCGSDAQWLTLLNETEEAIRNVYRQALACSTDTSSSSLLRSCGNIFLTGPAESGLATLSMLTASRTPDPTHRSNKVSSNTIAYEECRKMLIGALVRIVRRVNYAYFRPLWDECEDEYQLFLVQDAEEEARHRQIFQCRKSLYGKQSVLYTLNYTWKKMQADFGASSVAATRLGKRYQDTQLVVADEEAGLRILLDSPCKSSKHITIVDGEEVAIHRREAAGLSTTRVIVLGYTVFVLLENAFSCWLNSVDGQLVDLPVANYEVGLSAKELDKLDLLLSTDASNDSSGAKGDVCVAIQTIMCFSPSPLLPTAEPQHHRPLPTDPSLIPRFYFNSLDIKRIFLLLSQWQMQDNSRSSCISFSGSSYAARGLLDHLHVNDEEATNDRAKIEYISIGSLLSAESGSRGCVGLNKGIRSGELVQPKDMFGTDIVAEVSSEFSQITSYPWSYWDISNLAPSSDLISGEIASFNFNLITSIDKSTCRSLTGASSNTSEAGVFPGVSSTMTPMVLLGPVVGKLTCSSANILLELSPLCAKDVAIALLLTDAVTGVEYSRAITNLTKPIVYEFNKLEGGHQYDIRVVMGDRRRNHISVPIICGSFILPREIPREMVAGQTTTSRPTTTGIVRQNKKFDMTKEESTKSSIFSAAQDSSFPYRMLIVGCHRPSSINCTLGHHNNPHDEKERLEKCMRHDTDNEGLQVEMNLIKSRLKLEDGMILCHTINNMVSSMLTPACTPLEHEKFPASSGIDLVLHIGCGNVDLCTVLPAVVSTLAQADPDSVELVAQAKQQLRAAYYLHWGSSCGLDGHRSSMSTFLAHSCHLFVPSSDTSITLLLNMQRKHTIAPWCERLIHSWIKEFEHDYQTALWREQVQLHSQPHLHGDNVMDDLANCDYIHFLEDQQTVVFILQPKYVTPVRSVFCHREDDDSVSSVQNDRDSLLSNVQLSMLRNLLDVKGTSIAAMCVVSPIPLLRLSDSRCRSNVDNAVGTSSQQRKLHMHASPLLMYSNQDIVSLLDIVFDWKCKAANNHSVHKEITIICSSEGLGYTTTVEQHEVSQHHAHIMNNIRPVMSIQQVCCGSLLSTPLTFEESVDDYNVSFPSGADPQIKIPVKKDAIPRPRTGESTDPSHQNNTFWSIRSRNRHTSLNPADSIANIEGFMYHIYHSNVTAEPHCGLIERPRILNRGHKPQLTTTVSLLSNEDVHALHVTMLSTDATEMTDKLEGLWESVQSLILLSENDCRDNLESDMVMTEEAEGGYTLSLSLFVLFRQEKNVNIFRECFQLFQAKYFGWPGCVDAEPMMAALTSSVVPIISSMIQWVLHRLPSTAQDMLSHPSSYVIRKVWCLLMTHFIMPLPVMEVTHPSEEGIDAMSHSSALTEDTSVTLPIKAHSLEHHSQADMSVMQQNQSVIDLLCVDEEYFEAFLFKLLQAASLLEQFSEGV